MKLLIVLFCAFGLSFGLEPEVEQKIKEYLLKMAVECTKEVDAGVDDISPIKSHQAPTTQKGKCFLFCMQRKMNIQDGDGKIDKEGALMKIEMARPLDEELYTKMKQVIGNCIERIADTDDPCETALNMYVCLEKERNNANVAPLSFD